MKYTKAVAASFVVHARAGYLASLLSVAKRTPHTYGTFCKHVALTGASK